MKKIRMLAFHLGTIHQVDHEEVVALMGILGHLRMDANAVVAAVWYCYYYH